MTRSNYNMPVVWLVGDAGQSDFRACIELLDATASVVRIVDAAHTVSATIEAERIPDVIVLAASRPGTVRTRDVERLRCRLPLAGFVSLLGSWCEGETRTGRPAPGVLRCYWYDFENWWRRQISLLSNGNCPDWGRPATEEPRYLETYNKSPRVGESPGGLIVLQTTCWETGDVLGDVLRVAGYATAWIPAHGRGASVRGAMAGIWEGRQLDSPELGQLSEFCQQMAKDGAPVVALADFPRRDRCEFAYRAGAAAVLGKPWLNADLLATLERLTKQEFGTDVDQSLARAA